MINDYDQQNRAASGEIDIMEARGQAWLADTVEVRALLHM